ncbi:hypothetical protein N798_01060 [Knoellia flava TL1]|nr:hypothetical protein [Knoellia flava]KGN36042.1 hypothetical protein N798_01060 [Knoellia flava TL1]
MDLRAMSTERLVGVTARLLAAAAVLVAIGLGLVARIMWQQTGQSFGEDGTPTDLGMDLATRITLMVFETGYRPLPMQALLASVLLAAAVAAFHRKAASARLGSLRWEVLGAGVVVLVAVVVLFLAHLYVLTADDSASRASGYLGPQSVTPLLLGNVSILIAALGVMAVATLWWLRSGPLPDDADESADEVEDEDEDEDSGDGDDTGPVGSSRSAREVRDDPGIDAPVDYSRDWSPEDFRPPH